MPLLPLLECQIIATKTEDESLLLNEGHRTGGSIELQLQCMAVHGFVSKWVK